MARVESASRSLPKMKTSRPVIALAVAVFSVLCVLIAIWISGNDADHAPRRRERPQAKVLDSDVTLKPIRRSPDNVDGYITGVSAELSAAKVRVLQKWSVGASRGPNILINEDRLQTQAMQELLSQRDDREITLAK